MTSKEVKNKVRDEVERGFDKLHKIADTVTFPLAPLDGAIHGAARGLLNWATDCHPKDRPCPNNKPDPNYCPGEKNSPPGHGNPNPSDGKSIINNQQNIAGINSKATGNNNWVPDNHPKDKPENPNPSDRNSAISNQQNIAGINSNATGNNNWVPDNHPKDKPENSNPSDRNSAISNQQNIAGINSNATGNYGNNRW